MKRVMVMVLTLLLTACDYTEVKREIGYKGKARVDPWLAAERFVERMGRKTRPVISWTAPRRSEAVWLVPAAILSNESFTRRMEEWVREGGHLILLVEHADAETNDWPGGEMRPSLETALLSMLERAGIELDDSTESSAEAIAFDDAAYKVDAKSQSSVSVQGGKPGVFGSVELGRGQLTVVTDGRMFRNRWIGDNDHAALLDALIESTGSSGAVGFMRGAGLSLWALLKEHLWPVLIGLAVWILLWLWKSLTRFGPVESAAAPPALRGYEHHLEALGDFQWRIDRAASLLAPLRAQVVELGQQTRIRAGRRDDDLFQFLADRAGLPRERVFRALAEAAPADASVLTRTTVDLQQLLKFLHNPISS